MRTDSRNVALVLKVKEFLSLVNDYTPEFDHVEDFPLREALNKCSSFTPVAKATLILLDLRHG